MLQSIMASSLPMMLRQYSKMQKKQSPEATKRILIKGEAEVSEGVYFLNAAPLNLSGADGSPCRAVLIANER